MEFKLCTKEEVRSFFREKRQDIPESEKIRADMSITEKVLMLDDYKRAKVVLAYYPIKNEVNILPVVEDALSKGKNVAFPISDVNTHTLTFRFVSSVEDMKKGAYSIPEPSEESGLFEYSDCAICIVPGLVFDRSGNRLGYGKGFYDRFLSSFDGVSLGVCRSDFLVNGIPADENDRRVDIIISDTEEVFVYERK